MPAFQNLYISSINGGTLRSTRQSKSLEVAPHIKAVSFHFQTSVYGIKCNITKKLDPKLVPERAQHNGGKMWHEMNQPYFSTPNYKVLFQYYDILPHYFSVLQSTTPWSKYIC